MAVVEGLAGVSHVRQRGEAAQQAGVDGGRGFAVELLVDDGLGEGLKGALFGGNAHGEWADPGDEFGEFGVKAGHGDDDTASGTIG